MDKKFNQEYGTKPKPKLATNGWTKDDQENDKEEKGHPLKITETVNILCN